jgi:hypothetical protein
MLYFSDIEILKNTQNHKHAVNKQGLSSLPIFLEGKAKDCGLAPPGGPGA